ncbi:MAG: hypothetical protein R3E39_14285 [Anaerolineae bacterium]
MRIQRVRRRGTTLFMLCGCLTAVFVGMVLLAIGLLILLPRLPGLALLVSGFTARGNIAQAFANVPTMPRIQLQDVVTPGRVLLNLGSAGTEEIPSVFVQTGLLDGTPAATILLSEDDLMVLCRQRTSLCSNDNPQYQNVRVDLRPGGGVVYADVHLPEAGISQTIGAVVRLDGSQRQFELLGVDMGGVLYGLPTGSLAAQVQEVTATANAMLQQAILNVDGSPFELGDIRIDDSGIMFLMR